jgi:Leucine-rich repeat (LRR) protein
VSKGGEEMNREFLGKLQISSSHISLNILEKSLGSYCNSGMFCIHLVLSTKVQFKLFFIGITLLGLSLLTACNKRENSSKPVIRKDSMGIPESAQMVYRKLSRNDFNRLPKHIRALDLTGSEFKMEDLLNWEGLTDLEKLDLTHTNVSDEEIQRLPTFNHLRALHLDHTKITAASLPKVANYPLLEELNLAYTELGPQSLDPLPNLRRLKKLDLRFTKIADDDLRSLQTLRLLETIWLSGNRISDNGLLHLVDLERLQGLYLSSTRITPNGISNLSPLKNLKTLWVINRNFASLDVEVLKPHLPTGCRIILTKR